MSDKASGSTHLLIPFTEDSPSGLLKKRITITGTAKANSDVFSINLCTDSDIAFHFNPRFDEKEKVIVRNSRIGGTWGTEERDGSTFPFITGKPFVMEILVTESCFKVKVDGSDLLEFTHRVNNLEAINRIESNEDITVSKFSVEAA